MGPQYVPDEKQGITREGAANMNAAFSSVRTPRLSTATTVAVCFFSLPSRAHSFALQSRCGSTWIDSRRSISSRSARSGSWKLRPSAVVMADAQVAQTYPKGSKPVGDIEKSKPRLWIYDHCPYCVRPRMILGLKGISHDLVYLSNDDIDTPTAMVGKKIVPIMELGRRGTDEHEVMVESLDIVRRLDEDPAFGSPMLAPAADRPDIEEWVASTAMLQRRLLRPRHATTPLPEFQTRSAREAFVRNHPLPDPSNYDENFKNSPDLIEQMERALWKLENMIGSSDSVSPDGKISYDDITLWPRLRGLTIVDGLGIPPKIRAYLEAFSERCDIPLYFKMAS